MNSKEFKKLFGEIAKNNGFESAFGGWFKDSPETIIVLDLQKSNYGDYYELNIKIFIQGVFGIRYHKNKDLVKKEIGNISRRQPPEYRSVFNFDEPMENDIREKKLKELFSEFIVPFTHSALNISGIIELEKRNQFQITPSVKNEIEKL
ncbi:DUF4304 domain-containing protein [Chryseobacterium flavum]|uniref:DUF4304 domain-containing protein n=1 Tax=Chryseobacterium flavum TaxID=415851 RepID=UPI002FDA9A4D